MEKKKGRTQLDHEKAVENARKIAAGMMERLPWIRLIEFIGDPSYKSGRRRDKIRDLIDAGEEVSFGLNMRIVYEDIDGNIKETEAVIKYRNKKTKELPFRALKENPTREDLIKQWSKVWLIIYMGGTVEKPQSIVVTILGEFPVDAFVKSHSKEHKGQWRLLFGKWVDSYPCRYKTDLFNNTRDTIFDKIRRWKG